MTDPNRDAAVRSLLADIVEAWNSQARRTHSGGDAWRPPDPRYPSITCPVCGATSYSRHDIADGYCGNCCARTSPPGGNPPAPVS